MRTLWVHTMPMLLAEAHETLAEVLLRAAPGFSVDEIKALPENKALFATRTELVLNEGDKIWVPDEAPAPEWLDIKVGQELKLVVAGRQFKMKLHYPNRKPIKSQPFQLITEGKTYDGTTGGDGLIDLVVPTKATHCVVTVNGYRQQFLLGQLAPITTKKGVQARLRNLGYAVGLVDGEFGPRSIEALKAFQRDHGLPVTGAMSPNTQAKLMEEHGA